MQEERFSLINKRYDPLDYAKPNQRTFDSTENIHVRTTLAITDRKATVPFKSTVPKLVMSPLGCGSNKLDFSTTDINGFKYELSKKNETKLLQRFSETKKSGSMFPDEKKRIDCPTMHRVMDNIHDGGKKTLADDVREGNVKGGVLPTTARKPLINPATHLGPGDYNTTAHERGVLDNARQKFSTAPSGRGVGPELPKLTTFELKKMRTARRKLMSEGDIMLSSSEIDERIQLAALNGGKASNDNQTSTSLSPTRGAGKFSKIGRWVHPVYKQEKYVKTTGLTLSQNWDAVLDKRIPITLDTTSKICTQLSFNSITSYVDVDVDCGPKATTATKVRTSPIKYAFPFKSRAAEVGLAVPMPASGVNIGPASFPGTFKSTLIVRNPSKPSNFFLKDRELLSAKVAAPDIEAELKPPAPIKGGKFNTAKKHLMENKHDKETYQERLAKKKIGHVYPRMAKKMNGEIQSLDDIIGGIAVDEKIPLQPLDWDAALNS